MFREKSKINYSGEAIPQTLCFPTRRLVFCAFKFFFSHTKKMQPLQNHSEVTLFSLNHFWFCILCCFRFQYRQPSQVYKKIYMSEIAKFDTHNSFKLASTTLLIIPYHSHANTPLLLLPSVTFKLTYTLTLIYINLHFDTNSY